MEIIEGYLEIIEGNKEQQKQKKFDKKNFLSNKYKELYLDYLYGFEHLPDLKKAAFYGVKYIYYKEINIITSYKELLQIQTDIQDIISLLKKLTMDEIINMFPIGKYFDGEKYEAKDYFSTIEYLSNKDTSKIIGEEIYDFFFSYYNIIIINFSIKEFLIIDKINKINNKPGLLEGFLDIIDSEHKIDTYTIHEKEGYVYNQKTGKTGKLIKPKKRKPKYLTIVK